MKKALSKYAKVFDERCPDWTENYECNLTVLKLIQQYATRRLEARRTLFLNEVYEMLGLPRTQEGQIVGWHYDLENPIGDNFVDFCIEGDAESNTFTLDFNVDGKVIQYL